MSVMALAEGLGVSVLGDHITVLMIISVDHPTSHVNIRIQFKTLRDSEHETS